jgi:hypothetical protein
MANTKITTDALADGAITSAKLGSGAVNTQVASYLSSNSFVDTTALNSAVSTAVSNLVGSAPSTLDTLEELATSIGNSATLSSTLTSSIATKLPLAGGTLTGDLILGDSIKLELGAGTGGDLQLYHDGSHSYVTNTYASGALKLVSDDFRIENASNRNQLKTGVSGAVQLFFDDGSATGLRLGTTAAGVDVTGNIVVSGTVDGVDIAARDAVLTSTTTTAGAALPKAGGTMTGSLEVNNASAGNTVATFKGTYGSGGDVQLVRFERGGGAVYGAISYKDATTDMEFGTISSHALSLTTGNTRRLTIDNSGNVGIGTTAPNGRLQFDNAADTRKIVLYEGADNDYQFYGFGVESQTLVYSTYTNTDDHVFFSGASSSSRNELMRIEGGGNVGIGTDTPNSWASYTDSTATVLQVEDSSQRARIVINGGNGAHLDLVDYAGGTNDKHMNIAVDGGILKFGSLNDAGNAWVKDNITVMDLGSGNVGIGTSSPAHPFHITKELAGYQAYFNNDNGSAQGIKVRIKSNDSGNFNMLELVSASTGSDVTAMVVRDDGNVGIGTSSPVNAKLEIESSTDQGLLIQLKNTDQDSNTYMRYKDWAGQYWDTGINWANNDYYFKYGGAFKARFTNAGGLQIDGSGASTAPTLALNSTTSTTFNHSINAFNANLASGENQLIAVGQEGSTKNSGYIGYKWISSGNNGNMLTFGHWGNDNIMNLTADGKLGIGTTGPTAQLDVRGAVSSIIAMTSAHGYSSNRNWRFVSNNFGSGNWGGFSLERSTGAGGAPSVPVWGIDINGNTGIGIGGSAGATQAAAKLDVGGTIRAADGILFGTDTAVANRLDDYEEGTWTPEIGGVSGGLYTMGGGNTGRYTKIGRVVTLNFTVQWTGRTTAYSGHAIIKGIPFTSTGSRVAGVLSAASYGVSYPSGSHLNLVCDPNRSDIYLIVNDPTGAGYSHSPSLASTGLIYACSIVYEA